MIKTLYKTFQHWSDTGSVYIISDSHFMDYDMNWRINNVPEIKTINIEYFTEEQKAIFLANYLVSTINDVCHKNDTLILLGDIGDESWLRCIKANYKILITGNHDRGHTVYEKYFNEIYDGPLFISRNIVLSHEPLPWIGEYAFNIHGHEHYDRSDEYLDFLCGIKVSDCYLNACCEHNAFVPMNLGTIIKDKGLGKYQDIHRITIDKATENSLKK